MKERCKQEERQSKHMKFKLYNNNVLCKCVTPKTKRTESGIEYLSTHDLSIYEVVAVSDPFDKSIIDIAPGDKVIANSRGSTFEHEGNEFCIFNLSDIQGKII